MNQNISADTEKSASSNRRRMLCFSHRVFREMLRDPLNLAFGAGFPVVLLILLSAIQSNVPVPLFEIEKIAPAITVFGLSFLSLFSGVLIAKDRTSSFLMRLYTTPMTARDFILGYTMPLIPMAAAQSILCFLLAFCFGLAPSVNILFAVLLNLVNALLFIGIGLFCGSVMNDKQVGGICGALLTNLTAFLSGTWFDLALIGGTYQKIANLLPFVHATELERGIVSGDTTELLYHLAWVVGYAVFFLLIAIFAFRRRMKQ